jgi:hypothetical protein
MLESEPYRTGGVLPETDVPPEVLLMVSSS